MKSLRLIVALAIAGFVAAAVQANDAKKEESHSKPAPCCAKAAEKGEKCTKECCVKAAKEGNNCEHCHGSGKIEHHEEHKAEEKK